MINPYINPTHYALYYILYYIDGINTNQIHQPHVMMPSASRVVTPGAETLGAQRHRGACEETPGDPWWWRFSTLEGLNEQFRPNQLVGYFGPQVVYRFYSLVMPGYDYAWLWVGNLWGSQLCCACSGLQVLICPRSCQILSGHCRDDQRLLNWI